MKNNILLNLDMTQRDSDNEIKILAVAQLLEGAGAICQPDLVYNELELQGWIIHPVFFTGKVIGAIIQKEGEIHTSIVPKYQKIWNPRPYIKNILYPALEKYGEINSEASKCDIRGIKWLTKLGFFKISEDELKIYFRLKKNKNFTKFMKF